MTLFIALFLMSSRPKFGGFSVYSFSLHILSGISNPPSVLASLSFNQAFKQALISAARVGPRGELLVVVTFDNLQ